MEKSQKSFPVRHVQVVIPRPFGPVAAKLEQRLGKFEKAVLSNLDPDEKNAGTVFPRIKAMEGPDGLMLFDVIDHGLVLTLQGKPFQAKQYVVGNPLIAVTMTEKDVRAGLYAPLRLYVYEDGGKTKLEYDLPSDLFGQWGNPEVDEVARGLDRKMESLLNYLSENV